MDAKKFLELYDRGKTGEKVEKDDCKDNMCSHYKEIQNLWKETRDQGERIAKLEP